MTLFFSMHHIGLPGPDSGILGSDPDLRILTLRLKFGQNFKVCLQFIRMDCVRLKHIVDRVLGFFQTSDLRPPHPQTNVPPPFGSGMGVHTRLRERGWRWCHFGRGDRHRGTLGTWWHKVYFHGQFGNLYARNGRIGGKPKNEAVGAVLWNRNRKNRNFLPCGTGTVTR